MALASDRTIYIIGEIDSEKSAEVLENLIHLSRVKKPILIIINSGGGDAAEGLAMYDAIKLFPHKVFGLVIGQCYSAAATVLQACTVRMMSPNSRFMIHLGSFSVGSAHAEEALRTVQEEVKILDQHDQLIALRSGQTITRIKDTSRFAKYLSASEAVKEGFADKVVSRITRK